MIKFQLERIALFSDAVFAIAITLMMIEVKPPHLEHGVSFWQGIGQLIEMSAIFFGTILSFILIGIFWMRHHQMMKHLAAYSEKLLWINLVFLLCIAFIPFSTTLVFENTHSASPVPLFIYNMNLIAASFCCFWLFRYILNPKNNVCREDVDDDIVLLRNELLFPVVVYLFVIILAFVTPNFASIGYAAFGLEAFITGKKKPQKEEPAG